MTQKPTAFYPKREMLLKEITLPRDSEETVQH